MIATAELSVMPIWVFMAWIVVVVFCSPVLFMVTVSLPELPLRLYRRIRCTSYDSRWKEHSLNGGIIIEVVFEMTSTSTQIGSTSPFHRMRLA